MNPTKMVPSVALPFDLSGRVVFVAGGGSSGPGWSIGRAASMTYARLGASVCVVDCDAPSAEETAALIKSEGGLADTFVGDVSVQADVKRLFSQARERFGGAIDGDDGAVLRCIAGRARERFEQGIALHFVIVFAYDGLARADGEVA